MAKLGILTFHGMGNVEQDFDIQLRQKLQQRWPTEIRNNIAFQNVHYHPAMQEAQEETQRRMRDQHPKLKWKNSREFFMYAFSDAITYQLYPNQSDSVYQRVHQIVKTKIDELQAQLEPNSPIVVIAQSLGCQVLSNYIWDIQHRKGIWTHEAPDDIQALSQLQLVLTTGCNIPLFVAGLPENEIVPIAKPHEAFRWLNFFDNHDVLGWPLQPLSPAYSSLVKDQPIDVGLFPSNLTPLSHMKYWEDGSFIKPAAEEIAALYKANATTPSPTQPQEATAGSIA